MKNKRRKRTLRLKPDACQPTQAETESRTAALVAVAFLALHVLPVLWRSSPLWGADLLFYLSPLSQASFLLAAVLLFVPVFRRQVRTWLRTLPFSLWEPGRRTWLTKSSILLASLAAFVALRTANHLLGDGYLYLRELDADHPVRTERAPLAFALIQVLHSMGGVSGETAESTYRLYSYASGVLFVLLCFPVAGALGRSPREKSIALAFLLTGGYLQLFFGYVETYALCMPGILLYLLLGLRVLENRMSILFPAILLVLLVNLHLALALLGPSLLLLGYHSYRNRREAPRWKTWLDILSVLSFLPASAVLFLWLTGIDLATYLSGTGGSHLLPVFAEPGFGAQYRLFSLPHFLDFCNLQVLAAPGACMTLAILDKRAIGHRPFLLAAAAFPLLFTFLANPEIGAFRDWDFLALPAVPLTIWAASTFLARMRDRKGAFHAAFPICGSAALHSLMWVGLNARGVASTLRRFPEKGDPYSGHECIFGCNDLRPNPERGPGWKIRRICALA